MRKIQQRLERVLSVFWIFESRDAGLRRTDTLAERRLREFSTFAIRANLPGDAFLNGSCEITLPELRIAPLRSVFQRLRRTFDARRCRGQIHFHYQG